MSYIGIDLHSNNFTCNFFKEGNSSNMITYPLNEDSLKRFYTKLSKEDYISVEASTNTFSFCDLIKDKVKDVLVINPLQFQIIHNSGKKTDKIDAFKLSKMLKYHVESDNDFLPTVYVPEENARKLRALFTTYKLYKKQITSLKNRIHSILKQNLKPYNKKYIFSSDKRNEILNLDIAGEYKIQIKMLYETVEHLEKKAEEIKKEILYTGKNHKEEIEILTSVHGISPFVAIALISDYVQIDRFKNGKHFSSYLRSTPKVDSSNDTTHIGKTHKQGRKLSISLLLQSITHFKKINPNIESFYEKKTKGKSKGKVRMAIVRKMFVSIYYMLRDKKYYRYRNIKTHQNKLSMYENFIKKYEKTNIKNEIDSFIKNVVIN